MECVEGRTLAELLAERPARSGPDRGSDPSGVRGLEHAHATGLVHRDIKPQNLLVRDDDTLKIVDFGIARPVDGTQLTLAGTILGPHTLAPEQALGERVTAAADLYSLGAVTYEAPLRPAAVRVRVARRAPGQATRGAAADRRRLGRAAGRRAPVLAPDPANRPASAAALRTSSLRRRPSRPRRPCPPPRRLQRHR